MPFHLPGISGQQKKTLSELQERNEEAEVELSIAQKEAAMARLRAAGLTKKDFGGNWGAIVNWLKTH